MAYGDYRDKRYLTDLAAKAGAADIPWVKTILNSTLLLQKAEVRQKLLRFLSIKIQQNVIVDHPFLPAPSHDQVGQGDDELCRVVTGKGPEYPAKIKRPDWSVHAICTGPTGRGKTTLLVSRGMEIHRRGLNPSTGERETAVWFFDTDCRYIPGYLSAASAVGCQDVLIIHVRSMFKLNRWKAPAGVEATEHISKLTVHDREIRFARDYMMYLTRDAAFELLNRHGVFNERQLLDHISAKKFKPGSRDSLARESLMNRMRDPLQYLSSVYDTLRSHDLRALTRRSVVWDLHDLSPDHIGMFVGDLVLQLQEMMPVYPELVAKLLLIFDEFSHVCNITRLQRADLKEPFMLEASRFFRRRGVCLIIGIQDLFSVPQVILSNIAGAWLAFRPAEGQSANILATTLNLDRDQKEYMAEMPDRQVVCRMKEYPKPFLGSVGEIHLPIASDEQIAERKEQTQKVLDSLLEPEPASDQLVLFSEEPTPERAETLYGYYDLSKPCLDYLEFLARPTNTLLPMNQLDEAGHLSQYKAHQLRQQLAETGPGLIRLHRISSGKRGGPLTVVEITEAGYHLLNKLNVTCQRPAGHGGIAHSFWQHVIYRWALARGHPTGIEKWQSNKSVDVGIEWDEKKVAVEVALEDMEKEMNNLIKDLEGGWDQIVFAALGTKELNELKNEIAKRFGSKVLESDKVAFMKLSTFLDVPEEKED